MPIELPLGFYAEINQSGTHIHKGYLKVRVDIYSPLSSKTFLLYYVDHLDREPTEEELKEGNEWMLDLIPKHKELNPILCHFIRINPETTKAELEDIVKQIFDTDTLQQLDNAQSNEKQPDRLRKISRLMSAKPNIGRQLSVKEQAQPNLIEQVNANFKEVTI